MKETLARFKAPEYWSGPGNWTRDLPLCSQALYQLIYRTLDCILPANVDGRGVGDTAAVDAYSSERGLPVATWPGCSVSKVSWDSADESDTVNLLTNLNSFKSVCMYLKWPSPTPFPQKSSNRPIVGGAGYATPSWLCVRHFVLFKQNSELYWALS